MDMHYSASDISTDRVPLVDRGALLNEASIRREVYSLLRGLGYWPTRGRDTIVCPVCGREIHPPIGRPDLLVLAPRGVTRVLEVKAVNWSRTKSFPFSDIKVEQRNWLNGWTDAGGIAYLAIGTVNVRPRRLWVVDWTAWLGIEENVLEFQESVPIDLEQGRFKKSLQNRKFDLSTLGKDYELERRARAWHLPGGHTLLDEWSVLNGFAG